MTEILRTVADTRSLVSAWKKNGLTVGVVPTMGALHEGHLALVRLARETCDRVIVTIFVNPIQFNNADDLAKYPRTEEADVKLLSGLSVEAVFAPSASEIYPDGFVTKIHVGGVADTLEGIERPGHFDGVATVVTKLFGITQADRAFFGEKDWQQLQVVRRFVADLNLAVEIVGVETSRAESGLALSSRNTRLSVQGLAIAPALHREMQKAAEALRNGGDKAEILAKAAGAIETAGFEKVEYLELREAASLKPIDDLDEPARLLAAAWLEGVRLIDNIAV